jgi:predicted nuclease of restriction endonuclease-like (RecB) superfamily
VQAKWSVRELHRQIDSKLFHRSARSGTKAGWSTIPRQRGAPETLEAEIKDPYVLEFLGSPSPRSEKSLESALIEHLTEFLLELGCGFTFVARQRRLQVGTESFFLDLLFYHRRLHCLVAIDLKLGRFTPADAGQMNLYLNCLREQETLEDEAPPIGIVLCSERSDAVARYALGGMTNRIFASRYRLALPSSEVLTRELQAERRRLESSCESEWHARSPTVSRRSE